MKRMPFIVIICLFYSCARNNNKKIVTIQKDNVIIKGNIINDTLFNDTILYYDLTNRLIASKVFKDGLLNGNSTEYLDSLTRITDYSNGLKNGFTSYLYLSGKIKYTAYYYYGLTVGPIEFFDQNGKINSYYFADFQNHTLLHVDYKNWKGLKDIDTKCTNFTTNIIKVDSTDMLSIFLYLIDPPRFSFNYSVVKRKNGYSYEEVKKIPNNSFYTIIELPILPDNEEYAIGLDIYDSITNKQETIYDSF